MSRVCKGNTSYRGGEWKVVSLISFLNPANVRVFASWLGLGRFRNSESHGRDRQLSFSLGETETVYEVFAQMSGSCHRTGVQ